MYQVISFTTWSDTTFSYLFSSRNKPFAGVILAQN